MPPEDALAYRAKTFDGSLRAQIAVIGLQCHPCRPKIIEGVGELQQLGFRVNCRSLVRRCNPGPPDLDAAITGRDVAKSRRSDRASCLAIDCRPRHVATLRDPVERLPQPRIPAVRRRA